MFFVRRTAQHPACHAESHVQSGIPADRRDNSDGIDRRSDYRVRGALSAALGGAACVLPNLLFALRLQRFVSKRPAASYPLAFLLASF